VLVEFAIVLPILLMLLMGIIEFGRAYNTQLALQASAREGARVAALGQPSGDIIAKVQTAASPHTVDPADIDLSGATCPDTGEGDAAVTVSKDFTFGIPFVTSVGDTTLTATGVMRCGV
jgi:Flp pilus assembly protein TadG